MCLTTTGLPIQVQKVLQAVRAERSYEATAYWCVMCHGITVKAAYRRVVVLVELLSCIARVHKDDLWHVRQQVKSGSP